MNLAIIITNLITVLGMLAAFYLGAKLVKGEPILKERFPSDLIDLSEPIPEEDKAKSPAELLESEEDENG